MKSLEGNPERYARLGPIRPGLLAHAILHASEVCPREHLEYLKCRIVDEYLGSRFDIVVEASIGALENIVARDPQEFYCEILPILRSIRDDERKSELLRDVAGESVRELEDEFC